MTDDLTHRCRSGDHCVARTADGPAVTAKANTICPGCVRRLQECLRQLPHLRDALRSFKAGSLTGVHGSKVNATPTPSAPVNLSVLDLIDSIDAVISRAGGPAVRISDLITRPPEEFTLWRGGRLGGQLLDGVDRALAIGVVWRKADGIVGLSRQWERRRTPCPRCGHADLGGWIGGDTVHCGNGSCRALFTWDKYQDFCLAKFELEKIERRER